VPTQGDLLPLWRMLAEFSRVLAQKHAVASRELPQRSDALV
jgi:hypothetical protein